MLRSRLFLFKMFMIKKFRKHFYEYVIVNLFFFLLQYAITTTNILKIIELASQSLATTLVREETFKTYVPKNMEIIIESKNGYEVEKKPITGKNFKINLKLNTNILVTYAVSYCKKLLVKCNWFFSYASHLYILVMGGGGFKYLSNHSQHLIYNYQYSSKYN